MKILKLQNKITGVDELYIGNEYSPDPFDMLERIKYLGANGCLFGRCTSLVADDKEKYEIALKDVKNLLTKNGYVLYNPCTVLVTHKSD